MLKCFKTRILPIRVVMGSFTNYVYRFLAFFDPTPPWLTALLNEICQIYLVTLTFHKPPPTPITVKVVCEWPLWNFKILEILSVHTLLMTNYVTCAKDQYLERKLTHGKRTDRRKCWNSYVDMIEHIESGLEICKG